jgi:rubrerythrin
MGDIHEMQRSLARLQQDTEQISSIFAKLVNGRPGYKAVVEMKKEPAKCKKCNFVLEGHEKFCPECGEKTEFKK